MNKIDVEFKTLQQENPFKGDYILLAEFVTYKKYSELTIKKLLSKLIPKSDYEIADKSHLIKHLFLLTQKNDNTY